MKFRAILATVAAQAIAVLAIQFVAMVTLKPHSFGVFSTAYLAGALILSLSLSFVCEPWARDISSASHPATWQRYGSVALQFSALGGVIVGVVLAVVPLTRDVAAYATIAIAASTYRQSVRYFDAFRGDSKRVLIGDLVTAAFAVTLAGMAVAFDPGNAAAMTAAWGGASVAGSLVSRRPKLGGLCVLGRWWTSMREHIRPLVRDSLAMDFTAVGTPYLLIPILGVAGFGVYRAVSNVAAPVRLLLNPLRPQIARQSISRWRAASTVACALLAGVALGASAGVALVVVASLGWDTGTLGALGELAVPVGIFVSANFVGHLFYVVARYHASALALGVARVIQVVLGVGGPVVGSILWGVTGAVWIYALCAAGSASVWISAVKNYSKA